VIGASASSWAAFSVFVILALPVCLWVAAIAFAMIADVGSSIFSAAQAAFWFAWRRLRGEEET
jgi:hypothetical protein